MPVPQALRFQQKHVESKMGISRNHKLKYSGRLNELINAKMEVIGELHEKTRKETSVNVDMLQVATPLSLSHADTHSSIPILSITSDTNSQNAKSCATKNSQTIACLLQNSSVDYWKQLILFKFQKQE